jgi:chitinase
VQDTTVNDGTYVGSFLPTLAAKDGEVLLRGIGTVSPPPTVSVGDASVLEGDSGARTMTFPVTLAQPARSTVAVDYSVTGVTATGATKAGTDVDFRTASGTLTFQPAARTGQTPVTRAVSVKVFGDTTVEPDETFSVTLSNPTGGAVVGRSDATGTIINDDPGTGLGVGVGDASIVEGNAGTRSVAASVTLSAAPGATTVSVPYTIGGGTAIWGKTAASLADFGGALSGTLTFRGAAITRTITIPIYGNTTPQIDRTIVINLGSVTGATVVRATGAVTILDDD